MIFTDNKTKNERLAICQGCEFFKSEAFSCGTFLPTKILKGELKGDEVEYKGKKYTLCGCNMRQKAKFKTAKCPVGKWKAVVNQRDLNRLKKLIEEVDGKRSIKVEQGKEILQQYNKTFDAGRIFKKCGSCLNDLIKESKEAIKENSLP